MSRTVGVMHACRLVNPILQQYVRSLGIANSSQHKHARRSDQDGTVLLGGRTTQAFDREI